MFHYVDSVTEQQEKYLTELRLPKIMYIHVLTAFLFKHRFNNWVKHREEHVKFRCSQNHRCYLIHDISFLGKKKKPTDEIPSHVFAVFYSLQLT